MRSPPEDKHDRDNLERLKAEPWMVNLLELNPEYPHWGPYEDYMCDKDSGWTSPVSIDSWKEFDWDLNDLNECVNFYFQIDRESKECTPCGQTGYNPETRQISDGFYSLDPGMPSAKRWCDRITQDEVVALQDAGRLRQLVGEGKNKKWKRVEGLTAEEVNVANAYGARAFGNYDHDGINRMILIETRAKRLGVWGHCEHCEGHGDVFTKPQAHLNLVLWIIHPRKGCSRGVEVKNVQQGDLPEVLQWLRESAQRNAERFSGVVNL